MTGLEKITDQIQEEAKPPHQKAGSGTERADAVLAEAKDACAAMEPRQQRRMLP